MSAFNAHSPLIPTRSPFRIRDSQLAKMQQSNNSNNHDNSDNRFSLAIEVNNMWNMKPIEVHKGEEQEKHYNINMFSSSHLLTQLLVSQAILDSNEFKIQSFEDLDKLKKELTEVHERINNLSKSIQLETRIINISKSLENKNLKNSRHSVLYLQNQRQHNEHKMKYMLEQLDYLKEREIDIKKILLQHNAAVLNKGIHYLESQKVSKPSLALSSSEEESEMNQIIKRIDSISFPNTPKNHLTIPQKLAQIEQYLNAQSTVEKSKGKQLALIKLEKNDLIAKLRDMESFTDKLLETITLYPKRQAALRLELSQYQSESMELKALLEENQHQPSLANYSNKQLLKDQSSYFDGRLQEQTSSLQQNKRTQETLENDYRVLSELGSQIQDMNSKDNTISNLNYELRGQQNQEFIEREKHRLKKLFDERELHWTEHTHLMEDSFDEIMDNFDKLTMQAIEFESHRMKYDRRIEELNNTIQKLEMELIEDKIKKIGHTNTGEQPTTASLRKEFRVLVADIKRAHQQRMDQEAEEINHLQKQLSELQSENNKFKYQNTMSTQTD